MSNEMLATARSVSGWRDLVAKSEGILRQKQEAFERENAVLLENIAVSKRNLATSEEYLRALALAAFEATGNKKPGPGVGIRQKIVVSYLEDKGLEWAKEHGLFLMLDLSAFDKYARLADPEDLPFVTYGTEYQVTISSDLSKALEGEQVDGGK